MTIDQIISTAASVGTCVAAILAYLSLRESSRQRKAANQPEIAIKSEHIFAKYLQNGTSWSRAQNNDEVGRFAPFAVRLFNIGLGAAKDISATWSFEIGPLADEINRLSSEYGGNSHVKVHSYGLVELSNDKGLRAGFNVGPDLNKTLDFVLPYKADDYGIELQMPYSYVALTSTYLQSIFSNDSGQMDTLKSELTGANLDLSYTDIGGQKYLQRFDVVLNIEAFFGGGKDRESGFTAILECRSIATTQGRRARAKPHS